MQARSQGGFGGQIFPLDKKAFDFLWVLRKKIQKNFWSKFFHTKSLKIPRRKISGHVYATMHWHIKMGHRGFNPERSLKKSKKNPI